MSSSPIPHSSVVIHTTIYQCVKVLCLHHRFRSWHIQTQTKCCGCWCHWIKQCVLDDLQHKHMTICVSGTSSACSCCIMPKLLWWERSHPWQRWKFLFQTCFSNFLLVVDWSIRMQHLKHINAFNAMMKEFSPVTSDHATAQQWSWSCLVRFWQAVTLPVPSHQTICSKQLCFDICSGQIIIEHKEQAANT
jgi:hypothetical protein